MTEITNNKNPGEEPDLFPEEDDEFTAPEDLGQPDTPCPSQPAPKLKGFDLSKFALDISGNLPTVVPRVETVIVQRPHRQWFFRVRGGDSWKQNVAVLHMEDEKVTYLVTPFVAAHIASEIKLVTLYSAYKTDGTIFLIPVPIFNDDTPNRYNAWNTSLLACIDLAKHGWVKAASDMINGRYQPSTPQDEYPEPVLSDLSMAELIGIAFRDRLIESLDHKAVKKLLGKI